MTGSRLPERAERRRPNIWVSQNEGTAPPAGGSWNRRNYFSCVLNTQEDIIGHMSLLSNAENLEFWLSSTLLALCMLNCSQILLLLVIATVNGVGSASSTFCSRQLCKATSLFNLHDGWAAKLY